MGDIINLNQQRKAKARTDKDKKASQNRVKFGQTKAEKEAQKKKTESAKRLLEGHKREGDEDEE